MENLLLVTLCLFLDGIRQSITAISLKLFSPFRRMSPCEYVESFREIPNQCLSDKLLNSQQINE